MRQLTSLDAQFLGIEDARTYGHVGSFAVYDPSTAPDGQLRREDLVRVISERLHLLPPFRWRLVPVPLGLDLPYWIEDPDFDLDYHVRESAVPPPGTDRQVAETVARIFARPLDRHRPLWTVYVIHGLRDGRVGLLTKVHHSAVDGVAGTELLTVLLDPSPEGREIEQVEPIPTDRVPGDAEMLGRGLLGLARQPLRAARALPSAVPNLTELPGLNAFPGGASIAGAAARVRGLLGRPTDDGLLEVTTARAPRTQFNGPISPRRRYAFGSVSLDTVKRVKNALGITVNDVVVALCATAVREWLLARDALPAQPLVGMVPVSVRQAGDTAYGNRVSAMIVPLATDEADPRDRLLRTHQLLSSAKGRHQALPAELLTDATSFIPPAVAALAARTTVDLLSRTRPPLNLVISNVPGPRTPLYCAGAQLQALFPVSAIVDGVGLNITVLSYRDHVDFGIITDHDLIDDAWSILREAERALEDMVQAVCGTAGGVDTTPSDAPVSA